VGTTHSVSLPLGYCSRCAIVVLLAALVLALGAGTTGLHWVFRSALVILLLTYSGWSIYRLLVPKWRALKIDDEQLKLIDRQGQAHNLAIVGQPFVSPLYIGIAARHTNGQCLRIGLFRSQMQSDHFRRLCVHLRTRML
jgi:hypothetical protein